MRPQEPGQPGGKQHGAARLAGTQEEIAAGHGPRVPGTVDGRTILAGVTGPGVGG
jgi:hypothetical protein